MTQPPAFVVNISDVSTPPTHHMGRPRTGGTFGGGGERQAPDVSFRFTESPRSLSIHNGSSRPIYNVQVLERYRAVNRMSTCRRKVTPGIAHMKLTQAIAQPVNVCLRFEDADGKAWFCQSDGSIAEVEEQ